MFVVYRVFGEDGADAALREFLSDGLERFDAKTKRTYAEPVSYTHLTLPTILLV